MNAGGVAELDYLEDAGPGIPDLTRPQPGAQEPPPRTEREREQAAAELAALPGWEQGTVEQFLKGTGAGVHMLVGVSERDWLMTERDLERIAPPLTRILNRWEPAVRVSPMADPLLVAHGFALYGWRSALERQRAMRDAAAAAAAEQHDRYETAPAPPAANGAGPAGERAASAREIPDDELTDAPRYFDTGGQP